MATAFISTDTLDPTCPNVTVRRDGKNRIIIGTRNELNDDQMKDIFGIVLLMHSTGLRLKDLYKAEEVQTNE